MNAVKTYEYVWLDGPVLHSKIKATIDATPPEWFAVVDDTQPPSQMTKNTPQKHNLPYSDCFLVPVQTYNNPTSPDHLVLCQVQNHDHLPHASNTREAAARIVTDEWWFGFEQEYYLTDLDGRLLGQQHGNGKIGDEHYCGVGADNVVGREIADAHLFACLKAGIEITGTNAEDGMGQWEYQCFGKGIKAADDLWVSRFLLRKIAEQYRICVNYNPMPKRNWYGSGMHTNFSNAKMRTTGGQALFDKLCHQLEIHHSEAMLCYGSDNQLRFTGQHKSPDLSHFSHGIDDRCACIRIPLYTLDRGWKGYMEDRRPASNADPYRVIHHILSAIQ